jgi:hypothetical protein
MFVRQKNISDLLGFLGISMLRVKLPTFVAAISELQLILLTLFDAHAKI